MPNKIRTIINRLKFDNTRCKMQKNVLIDENNQLTNKLNKLSGLVDHYQDRISNHYDLFKQNDEKISFQANYITFLETTVFIIIALFCYFQGKHFVN